MKNLLLLCLLFISGLPLYSQDSDKKLSSDTTTSVELNKKHNRLGFYGSHMSGGGAAYQYQFENGISLKLQALAYTKDSEESNDNDLFADIGSDIQFNLFTKERFRFYAMAGLMYFYNEESLFSDCYVCDEENISIEKMNHKSGINIGTGLGGEYKLFSDTEFSIALECGFYGSFTKNDEYDFQLVKHITRKNLVTLGGGLGFFYAF